MASILKAFGYGEIDDLYTDDHEGYDVVLASESQRLYDNAYKYILNEYMYSEGLITKDEYTSIQIRSEGFIDDLLKKGQSLGNAVMDNIAKIMKRIQEMVKNLSKNVMTLNKRVEVLKRDVMKATDRIYNEEKAKQKVDYYTVEQYEKEEVGEATIDFLRKLEVLKNNTSNDIRVDSIKNAKSFLDREFKNWDKIDNKEFNEMIREKYMLKNETTNKKTNLKAKNAVASKAVSEIQNSLTHTLKICDAITTVPVIEYLKNEEKEIDKNNREFEKLVSDYNKNNMKKESVSIADRIFGEASKLDSAMKNFKNPFSSGDNSNSDSTMDQAMSDAQEADAKEEKQNGTETKVDPAKEKEEAENKLVLDKIQLYFTTRSICTDSNIKYMNRVVSVLEKFGSENMMSYTFVTTTRANVKTNEKGAKK